MTAPPRSLDEARALIDAINIAAKQRGRSILGPPPEPAQGMCCGRGCERCVFVAYYEALSTWRRQALYAIFKVV